MIPENQKNITTQWCTGRNFTAATQILNTSCSELNSTVQRWKGNPSLHYVKVPPPRTGLRTATPKEIQLRWHYIGFIRLTLLNRLTFDETSLADQHVTLYQTCSNGFGRFRTKVTGPEYTFRNSIFKVFLSKNRRPCVFIYLLYYFIMYGFFTKVVPHFPP